jgi:carbonic anhydrase
LIIFKFIYTYDFNSATCINPQIQQSPINILSTNSVYYDEKYFRLLTNNYNYLTVNNSWSYLPEERAVGVVPTVDQGDFGSFIFVKDWAMNSFRLTKILFRLGSEHSIDGEYFSVEMQLIHTIDTNYYPPGRRLDLGVNYVVISLFFNVTADDNPGISKLFYFMNLEGFYNNTNSFMSRKIKFNTIIQHQPSYLYEGTLTYPDCQPALWLIMTQYHWISQSDYNQLSAVIKSKTNILDTILQQNIRSQFAVKTTIYRNWNDVYDLSPRVTLMNYIAAHNIKVSLLFLFLILSLLI